MKRIFILAAIGLLIVGCSSTRLITDKAGNPILNAKGEPMTDKPAIMVYVEAAQELGLDGEVHVQFEDGHVGPAYFNLSGMHAAATFRWTHVPTSQPAEN